MVREEDMALNIPGGTVEDDDEIWAGDEGQRRRGGQMVKGGEKAGELRSLGAGVVGPTDTDGA